MKAFLDNLAFREKMAWVSLIGKAVVWGYYFVLLGQAFLAPQGGTGDALGAFIQCTVFLIVFEIAQTILAGHFYPKEAEIPPDERERLIELKSTKWAYVFVVGGVVMVALSSPFIPIAPMMGLKVGLRTALVMANSLLLVVVLGDALKGVCQVVLYRKDATL